METKERMLVMRVLGADFLKTAQMYGNSMRMRCIAKGAKHSTAEMLGRIAEIAFVKGAESYRSSQWHEMSEEYPKQETFVLCKGLEESGSHLFLAKAVKDGNGGLVFVGEDGQPTEQVSHWMAIPNAEEI